MEGSNDQSGSRLINATIVSVASSPSNVLFPVSASKTQQSNAQMSVRLSTGFPRACSGLMYEAVPRIVPSAVPFVSVGG